MFWIATRTSWKMSSINILWTLRQNFSCFTQSVCGIHVEEFIQKRHLMIVCCAYMSHVAFTHTLPFQNSTWSESICFRACHFDVFLNTGLFWKRKTRKAKHKTKQQLFEFRCHECTSRISPVEHNASVAQRRSLNDFSLFKWMFL